jgi:hypothetical protein
VSHAEGETLVRLADVQLSQVTTTQWASPDLLVRITRPAVSRGREAILAAL